MATGATAIVSSSVFSIYIYEQSAALRNIMRYVGYQAAPPLVVTQGRRRIE
jgi:hypothetical protein